MTTLHSIGAVGLANLQLASSVLGSILLNRLVIIGCVHLDGYEAYQFTDDVASIIFLKHEDFLFQFYMTKEEMLTHNNLVIREIGKLKD